MCSTRAALPQLLGAEEMKVCSLLQRVLRALLTNAFDGLSISEPLGLHLRESLTLHNFQFSSEISDPQADPQCQVTVSLRKELRLLPLAPCCTECPQMNVFYMDIYFLPSKDFYGYECPRLTGNTKESSRLGMGPVGQKPSIESIFLSRLVNKLNCGNMESQWASRQVQGLPATEENFLVLKEQLQTAVLAARY